MRSNIAWFVIVVILLGIIAVLGWIIMGQPAAIVIPPPTPTRPQSPTTTTPIPIPATSTPPLSSRVSVAEPAEGATVGGTFMVSGKAPGGWYFEASFPIQVRDADGNVIGRAHGNAQGEWMTNELVRFIATVNIEGAYKGPATLILLRDNPSGLPENDDSVSIPIVIK